MSDLLIVAVLGGVAGAVAGALVSVVLPRVWRWRTPLVSADTGVLARRAVTLSSRVCQAVMMMNGRLSHPWAVDGETIRWLPLREDLRQAIARVSNKKFTGCVEMIQERLDLVEHKYVEQGPRVFVLGAPTPASYAEEDRRAEVAAIGQMQAAEEGFDYCLSALDILDELERHA